MLRNSIATNSAKKRIAVAMSGGVDSSVTAALLVEQGFEVVGFTMQLYDHGSATAKSKACCAGQDIYDARRVADKLGIPHYVLDFEKRFEESVIAPFATSYMQGETPIPCVLCNQTVKFTDLINSSKGIDAVALATGHYVRREIHESGVSLHRAHDLDKDQSYFLFATTPDQLDYLRFPLGGLNKTETRELAQKFDLMVADKPESQDICFVPTGKYTDVINSRIDQTRLPGRYIHVDGRDMGEHQGIENYTVGQRRGLGIGGQADPLYVVSVMPEYNLVIVGPKSALAKSSIKVRDVNWLGAGQALPADGLLIQARVRHTHNPVPAYLRLGESESSAVVEFQEPQYGVSPGQACVFYDKDRVLGGGWIIREDTSDFVPHNKRAEVVFANA